MPDPHRSDITVRVHGSWRECPPLPFYGIRKRCSCGRAFWRESAYEQHWKIENAKLLDTGEDRSGPLPWVDLHPDTSRDLL